MILICLRDIENIFPISLPCSFLRLLYIEKENAELRDIIAAASRSALTRKYLDKLAKPLLTSGEITPTDVVSVIAPNQKGHKALFPIK